MGGHGNAEAVGSPCAPLRPRERRANRRARGLPHGAGHGTLVTDCQSGPDSYEVHYPNTSGGTQLIISPATNAATSITNGTLFGLAEVEDQTRGIQFSTASTPTGFEHITEYMVKVSENAGQCLITGTAVHHTRAANGN